MREVYHIHWSVEFYLSSGCRGSSCGGSRRRCWVRHRWTLGFDLYDTETPIASQSAMIQLRISTQTNMRKRLLLLPEHENFGYNHNLGQETQTELLSNEERLFCRPPNRWSPRMRWSKLIQERRSWLQHNTQSPFAATLQRHHKPHSLVFCFSWHHPQTTIALVKAARSIQLHDNTVPTVRLGVDECTYHLTVESFFLALQPCPTCSHEPHHSHEALVQYLSLADRPHGSLHVNQAQTLSSHLTNTRLWASPSVEGVSGLAATYPKPKGLQISSPCLYLQGFSESSRENEPQIVGSSPIVST